MKCILNEIEDELTAILAPHWTELMKQSGGMLASHTILRLWRATQMDLFTFMTPEEKNVLKWACLLCDIAKIGTPLVQGRDHCHAFRSASAVLGLFKRHRLIE